MNTADDTKTFWTTAKDNGTMAAIIIPLMEVAQVYWATYGGESLCRDYGRLTAAPYHRIEV